MRKALALKEDELKAFFIKASARQKQHGTGCLLGKGLAMGQRACSAPTRLGPASCSGTQEVGHGYRYQFKGTASTKGRA